MAEGMPLGFGWNLEFRGNLTLILSFRYKAAFSSCMNYQNITLTSSPTIALLQQCPEFTFIRARLMQMG